MQQETTEPIDHQGSQRPVLIVEDESLLRNAYRVVLTNAGYCVVEAGDAAAALERLRATDEPDIALVVLDVGLPDLNGLDLLAAIREMHNERTLPVVVVSGADGLEDRLCGLRGGANDYLVKPVALPELVERVNAQLQLIERWRAQMEDVADTRRRMAPDLSEINQIEDLSHAMELITATAKRAGDVDGAAFFCGDGRLQVATAVGDVPFIEGAEIPDAFRAEMRDDSSKEPLVVPCRALGLDRPGEVALVPLVVSRQIVGTIAVVLTQGLPAEQAEAVVSATSDLAAMAAPLITSLDNRERSAAERKHHYRQLIESGHFSTVFQPIVELASVRVAGYEALTRFADGTRPDLVFADAATVGEGASLEMATALMAIERAESIPINAYLSINFSAATLLDTEFLTALTSSRREVVIEITEHDEVKDYLQLQDALETVRHHARIAVDDAGAGYAGLHHMRSLRPDVIKLDRSLVSALDTDSVGRAMVAGMVYFASETGSAIVAEGIETESELQTIIELGVSHGQGYLLGKPAPAAEWL